jgi:hypothetical protein
MSTRGRRTVVSPDGSCDGGARDPYRWAPCVPSLPSLIWTRLSSACYLPVHLWYPIPSDSPHCPLRPPSTARDGHCCPLPRHSPTLNSTSPPRPSPPTLTAAASCRLPIHPASPPYLLTEFHGFSIYLILGTQIGIWRFSRVKWGK